MNPERFLRKVEALLDGARPAGRGIYTLYLKDDLPLLIHGESLPTTPNTLAVLLSNDINEGLTNRRWQQIKDRYAIFTKRIEKCQTHPQPSQS